MPGIHWGYRRIAYCEREVGSAHDQVGGPPHHRVGRVRQHRRPVRQDGAGGRARPQCAADTLAELIGVGEKCTAAHGSEALAVHVESRAQEVGQVGDPLGDGIEQRGRRFVGGGTSEHERDPARQVRVLHADDGDVVGEAFLESFGGVLVDPPRAGGHGDDDGGPGESACPLELRDRQCRTRFDVRRRIHPHICADAGRLLAPPPRTVVPGARATPS